ncbi:TIGR02680 family protein [Nocardioides sp. SYSU DS0651]|uniref:TIGR02680 family protein n=1 Tax=Nocardioides sp. SYSU DS0651 TaxID=3415955 RepID=UPI003F4C551E
MTITDLNPHAPAGAGDDQTPAQHHPYRWRMRRAGIVNVWYYYDTEFDLSGGRLVLRGTNGSGKSRALEMLLPFLLDGDRRKMDATGANKVRLQDLMKAGGDGQGNRPGYLWLELARDLDPDDEADADAIADGRDVAYLTIGAFLRYSPATTDVKAWYFITDRRVGHDLPLLSPTRDALSREQLTELIGSAQITDSPTTHRDRVRTAVFGLIGETGRERYDGFLQLLHTLRSPDVGNRIEEGKLPQILSEALPPLSEAALTAAGEQLDGLSETRNAQERLEAARDHVRNFLETYRRYAAGALTATAEEALAAATAASRADKDATTKKARHQELVSELAEAKATTGELAEAVSELERTIAGIKASKAYAAQRDLDERGKRVDAQGASADVALGAAARSRAAEDAAADATRARAEEVLAQARDVAGELDQVHQTLAAAGLPIRLPEPVGARTTTSPAEADTVRVDRDEDPQPFTRPTATEVTVGPTPADLAAHLDRTRTAAGERQRHAATRLTTAQSLDTQQAEVTSAESAAATAAQRAEEAAATAGERAGALDTAVNGLHQAWSAWLDDPDTLDAFGSGIAWQTFDALQDFLGDPAQLTVVETSPAITENLDSLDRVPHLAASDARSRHTAQLARLADADDRARETRAELEAEKARLESAIDPAPAAPPWLQPTPEGEVPLWRAINFADVVPAADRAGLEGALLASGLLLATVTAEASLRAPDGQILIRPHGDPAVTPVTGTLVPDDASGLPAATVTAVLDRIGYGAEAGSVWVDTDGSWGAGALSGRHQPPAAAHIGAAARAAARARRLAEIAEQVADLDRAAEVRQGARVEAETALERINDRVQRAPVTRDVSSARVSAIEAAGRAEVAQQAADGAARRAEELRAQWAAASARHLDICRQFSLPTGSAELAEVLKALAEADRTCATAIRMTHELDRRLGLHADAVNRLDRERQARRQVEAAADEAWTLWHGEATELESIREMLGADAAEALANLKAAEAALKERSRELGSARESMESLQHDCGVAESKAATAAEQAEATRTELATAAGRLVRRYALPGLVAAATGAAVEPLEIADVSVSSVQAAANRVRAEVGTATATVSDTAASKAEQTLDHNLTGTLDVTVDVEDGVRLVEVSDAAGTRTVAEAADELERLCQQGRDALSDRERRVFTEFVLGGVAEELRRRIGQAEHLIHDMTRRLGAIRTSHGIGVKLRWRLAESADGGIARIRELVATDARVRSPENTAELTELLKARVDESFALDAAAGFAAHLRKALDYREWHHVEVIIMGPAPGLERRIARRAKLSQGEIRFVSYVTLFAAVDAYLSGLPDAKRALRLMLLDDAFAKVDDRTIGELMGLLVRLDLDFAMTGHALWGTYPQVPKLDCYEIRRVEGSAAVTTHVHWDGHNKHLRAAR